MASISRNVSQSHQLLKVVTKSLASQQRSVAGTSEHPFFHNPLYSTKYGGKHRVALIHGDGVGPEMMFHVKEALRHVRAPVDFEDILLNSANATETLIDQAVLAIKRNGVGLKGQIETDFNNPLSRSVNVQLRNRLELFANVVRCKQFSNVKTRHNDIDILIIRENMEGEYSNLEHENVPGVVESLKIITREKSMRVAEFAFARAKNDGRKKVTAVHKANIMKLSDGLFLECCKEVSKRYPEIKYETMIVDNTCMQLVSRPEQFDVMVMPNLYGNIIVNMGTGLIGGDGIVAGSNYGYDCALFETATRNSAKGIAGQNAANPSGILFAAAGMLKYIGLDDHSTVIKNAIVNTIDKHNVKTVDLGGQATTTDFMKVVLEEITANTPEIGLKRLQHAASSIE